MRTETFGKGGFDAYADLDANGRTIRTWRSSPDGLGYIRQDFQTDIRGLILAAAYPVAGQPAHDPGLPADLSRPLAMRWFDGLGRERESYTDFQNGLGHVLTRMERPRVTSVADGEGFQTELTRNAHGRIVEVRGGRNAALNLQATYVWDPPARLRTYTTAMGDQLHYDYDTADRLRTVSKGVAGLTPSTWYTYNYQGAKPYQVRDNTGKSVRFAFDSIIRLISYTVTDPVAAGGESTYRIEYDTQFPARASLREDPRGFEKLHYDAAGQEILRECTWTGPAVPLTRTLEYQHAATGELTGILSPSGTAVALTYAGGLLTTKTVTDPVNLLPLPIHYGYSPDFLQLNRIQAWEMRFELNRLLSPTRVDELRYDFNGIPSGIDYEYLDNGLVSSKTHGGSLLSAGGSQVYDYTDDRQIASVVRLPGTAVFEASYHDDGSLRTYHDAGGTLYQYVYAATGSAAANQGLRKPLRRVAAGVTTDRYRYDAAGRRTAWTTGGRTYEYGYDGLGRLRRVHSGGVDLLVYHYDATGAVTEEVAASGSVYRLGSWRLNASSGREEEDLAGVLTGFYTPAPGVGTYQRLWKFPDLDSHVTATFLENLIVASTRALTPFGEQILATGEPLVARGLPRPAPERLGPAAAGRGPEAFPCRTATSSNQSHCSTQASTAATSPGRCTSPPTVTPAMTPSATPTRPDSPPAPLTNPSSRSATRPSTPTTRPRTSLPAVRGRGKTWPTRCPSSLREAHPRIVSTKPPYSPRAIANPGPGMGRRRKGRVICPGAGARRPTPRGATAQAPGGGRLDHQAVSAEPGRLCCLDTVVRVIESATSPRAR